MIKTPCVFPALLLAIFLFVPFFSKAQEFLWGVTKYGGTGNQGVVYRISTNGTSFATFGSFNGSNGSTPGDGAGLTQLPYGVGMIGITELGTPGSCSGCLGAAFTIDQSGSAINVFSDLQFSDSQGSRPTGKMTLGYDNSYIALGSAGGQHNNGSVVAFKFVLAGSPKVPTYTTQLLSSFEGQNGSSPKGSLVMADDGNMFGMTERGGANGKGVIFLFKRIPTNTITPLVHFNGIDNGSNPVGNLITGSDGKLYGMTKNGGVNDLGVLFSLNQDGSNFKTLYHFSNTSGGNPKGSLVEFTDGRIYGMTSSGGSAGFGTIFSITTDGTFNKIFDFDGTNGKSPVGDLTVSTSGDAMFGTAFSGGANEKGTLFKLTKELVFQKLYDFTSAGSNPVGTLTMNRNTQTVSIAAIPDKYKTDAPFALTSQTSSGLIPSFVATNDYIRINKGTATINYDAVTQQGDYSSGIVAYQPGNYKYLPAYDASGLLGSTPSAPVLILQKPQTISYTPISSKKYGDPPFTFEPTSSSGLPVSISLYGSDNIKVDGNTITIIGTGTAQLMLSQAGNSVYGSAPDRIVNFGIDKAEQTLTVTTPVAVKCCEPFSISGTAKTPITFSVLTPDVGSVGYFENTITPRQAGKLVITGFATENQFYRPSEKITREIIVEKVKPVLMINSNNITAKYKDYRLSAVSSTYNLFEAPIIATSSNPGIAEIDQYGYINFIGVGTTRITVTQPATSKSEAAESKVINVTVNSPTNPGTGNTITWNSDTQYLATQSVVNLLASSTSGLPVTFKSSNSNLVEISGNSMKIKAVGNVVITAYQPGNDTIPAATPVEKFVGISKGYQNIWLPSVSSLNVANLPLAFPQFTEQGLPISYYSSNPSVAEIIDYKLVAYTSGSVRITARSEGNELLASFMTENSYYISLTPPTLFFDKLQQKTYGDAPFDLIANGGAGAQVSFASSDANILSISGNKATILKAGTVKIKASAMPSGYLSGAVEQTLVIAKAPQTITFASIANKNFGDPNFVVNAKSTSNLPIVIKTTTPGMLKISGNLIEITGSGIATLIATHPGTDNYLEAQIVSQSFAISDSGNKFSLYMSNAAGSPNGGGSVFSIDSDGNNKQIIKGFDAPGNLVLTGGFAKDASGNLYVNSILGGLTNSGTLLRISPDGSNFKIIASYRLGVEGGNPYTSPVMGADGYLYTTLTASEPQGGGSIVKIKPDGSEITKIYNFNLSEGYKPSATVLYGSDGRLYGTTDLGGLKSGGTIYTIKTDGTDFKVLKNISSNNVSSYFFDARALVEGSDGKLYGTTLHDGAYGAGTLFRLDKEGTNFQVLVEFNNTSNGALPGEIMIASDGKIYGATTSGGANAKGYVYSVNTDGNGFTKLLDMPSSGTGIKTSPLREAADGTLYGVTHNGGSTGAGMIYKMNKDGSGYQVLHSFDNAINSLYSRGELLETSPGVFFGAAGAGGSNNMGTIYKMTSTGDYTIVKSFVPTQSMRNGIGFDKSGENYLGTSLEPKSGQTSYFKLNVDNGEYVNLYSLPLNRTVYGTSLSVSTGHVWTYVKESSTHFIMRTNNDGSGSTDIFSTSNSAQTGSVVEAWLEHNGFVYGLTSAGGAYNKGTFFKINIDGTGFTKLTDLPANRPDFPVYIIAGSDGKFYAIAATRYKSVLLSLTTDGVYTLIKSTNADETALIKDFIELPNGEFAVLTTSNGSSDGVAPSIFLMDKEGKRTRTIFTFTETSGKSAEQFELTMDGWLYVRTTYSGATGAGNVFKIRTDGSSFTKIIDNDNGAAFEINSMFFRKRSQALTFDAIADKKVKDAVFLPTYTSSSGSKPIFTTSDPSVAVIDNGFVKLVGAGTAKIKAVIPENGNFYSSNSVEQEFKVTRDNQSIVFTNPGSRAFETGAFNLQATTSSGLPVSFTATKGNLTITGSTVSFTDAGVVSITASQSGDALYEPAESQVVEFCINPQIPVIQIEQDADGTFLIVSPQPNAIATWYRDNEQNSIALGTSIVASQSGTYVVEMSIDECKTDSAPVEIVITGVEDDWSNMIDIYPNPVSTELNISFNANQGALTSKLINITGKLVETRYTAAGSSSTIDLTFQPAGIYILRLESNGNLSYRKIVKE